MTQNFHKRFIWVALALLIAIPSFLVYKTFGQGTQYYGPAQDIAAGTAVMTTAAITAPACGTTVTVAAPNVLATDTITVSFNAAPAGTNAGLIWWPTAGNVNFAYCPGVTETPAAATINWKVVR